MNENPIGVELLVKFKVESLCREDDPLSLGMTFEEFVKDWIESDGLFDLVDDRNFEIIEIKKINTNNTNL